MCTGIRHIAENGAVLYGRTLEFGRETKSNIIMIPRNYSFSGTTQTENVSGLHWKSKYAVLGVNMLDTIDIIDGVNEKGLAGGLFYFPDYAEYQKVPAGQVDRSLAPWELMTWILTNFYTVSQVKEALPTIRIANTIFAPWNMVPPLHAVIHDLFGQSLVIEFVKGELFMHDNPLGVITNAPTFDWHITNLSNYINISPLNIKLLQLNGIKLRPLGQGSGMLGLPGDFTSPSRFVRAVAFMQTILKSKDETEGLNTVFHLLNLFDIPLGSVAESQDKKNYYEFTQWTSATDLKNKCFYWHTYENRKVHMIDLTKMDLNVKSPIIIQMHQKNSIADLTGR